MRSRPLPEGWVGSVLRSELPLASRSRDFFVVVPLATVLGCFVKGHTHLFT